MVQIQSGIGTLVVYDIVKFSGNCYLGRYNNWGQGIVEDPNTPITYHKSGQSAPYIYDPNYYSFGDTYSWAKWIYKYEHSSQASFRKCNFECYHDSSCDFFVDVHSHCCYGRYSYTGSQILSWTNNVAIHVKNGKIDDILKETYNVDLWRRDRLLVLGSLINYLDCNYNFEF